MTAYSDLVLVDHGALRYWPLAGPSPWAATTVGDYAFTATGGPVVGDGALLRGTQRTLCSVDPADTFFLHSSNGPLYQVPALSFTWIGWVRLLDVTATVSLNQGNGVPHMSLMASVDELQFGSWDASLVAPVSIPLDETVQIGVRWEHTGSGIGTYDLFLNGVSVGSGSDNATYPSAWVDCTVVKAIVGDISFYETALSDAQMLTDYEVGSAPAVALTVDAGASIAAVTTITPYNAQPAEYAAKIVALGPVVYWPLHGDFGAAVSTDDLVLENGTPSWHEGQTAPQGGTVPDSISWPHGEALGTSSSAYSFDTEISQTAYTLLARIRPEPDVVYGQGIISDWDETAPSAPGVILYYFPQGGIGVQHGLTYVESSVDVGPVTPLEWNDIAVTWDGTNIVLYVNGVVVGTAVESVPPGNSGGHQRVSGLGNDYTIRRFLGHLGDVAIFDRALPLGQILNLYNGSPYVSAGIEIGVSSAAVLAYLEIQTQIWVPSEGWVAIGPNMIISPGENNSGFCSINAGIPSGSLLRSQVVSIGDGAPPEDLTVTLKMLVQHGSATTSWTWT